ncbi:MAG: DMT family transporter [Vicinamibacterales bacterium]
MMIYELAALGAATCWALTSLISRGPAGHLGAFAFNRLRQIFVTLMLAVYVGVSGSWQQLNGGNITPILISGLIGIFAGDTLLFASLNRVGPRRSSILFAMNAPLAAVLGWTVLGEALPPQAVLGVAFTFAGVALAIYFGNHSGQSHRWEDVRGALWVGVGLGLAAAMCQAVASLIMRPVMASGLDPFAASLLRVSISAMSLTAVLRLPIPAIAQKGPLTPGVVAVTALSGILALAIGMTLLLYALSGGDVGIISTLSATSPVIILPMIWLRTGQRPAAGAWGGALMVILGMALIFAR